MNPIVFLVALLVALTSAFHNPIIQKGADPYVIFWRDHYYYATSSGGQSVALWKSKKLEDWTNAEKKVVLSQPHMTEFWAPEVHRIQGNFYIYYAADSQNDNSKHRMYVIKADDPEHPMGSWSFKGQLSTPDNNWAIDGTVFEYQGNNKLYFIWSGWSSPKLPKIQNLYIAEMKDPMTVVGQRYLLREPTAPWMKYQDFGINEGPEILTHANRTFLIYSASASWMGTYCLGMMGIDGGKDPLVASNWWKKDDAPVMKAAPQNSVYGPGHASYVNDRSGKPWIVYHAMSSPNGGWAGRSIRTQPFSWNQDGSPNLGVPTALSVNIPNPK